MNVSSSDEGTSYYTCSKCHKPCDSQTLAQPETDQALDMLRLILPMAKGYVHEHAVGNNNLFIDQADQLLSLHKQSPTKAGMSVDELKGLEQDLCNMCQAFDSATASGCEWSEWDKEQRLILGKWVEKLHGMATRLSS